jgi:hypothetical protein
MTLGPDLRIERQDGAKESLSVTDVPDSTARYAFPVQGSKFGISCRRGCHMDDTADIAP